MEDIAKNFVATFHNLQGVTIAEKKRDLFQLFNKSSHFQHQPLLDLITSQIKPQTHLERLFFVQYLIYYRQFDELYREFLKGNEIIVSKIAKEKWFFQHAFEQVGTEFVIHTLPILSYSLRLKILKKMVSHLKEEQADVIFDAILEMYGIFIATNVLTSCSIHKIEHTLKNYCIKLWINQLKILYNKNPTLIYTYLEEREKHEGNRKFMDSHPIFEYIAERDIEMYCDLNMKYNFNIKLGKRVTKKLVAVKKSEIIAKPELYVKNLNPAGLVRKLGSDFKEVYFKLFPKRIEDSPGAQSSRLLEHYPRNARYNLMLSTYNQIFQKKIDECPHLIDDYILRMIIDGKERERMAKIKGGGDNDSYIMYSTADHCIKTVKEKIKFARFSWERGPLVGHLVETCIINNDYDALIEVTKFVSERFKNDTQDIQINFLQALLWKNCNFDKFNDQQWQEIKKIIGRKDFYDYYEHVLKSVFFKYVEFLVKTEKPVRDEILFFFKGKQFNVQDLESIKNANAKKLFISEFIELAPHFTTSSNSIENVDLQLILACKQLNPKNTIQIWNYPRLIASLKNILDKKINIEHQSLSSALEFIICTNQRSEELEQLRQLYCSKFAELGTRFAVKWFLRHEPEIIAQHLEQVLTFCISNKDVNEDKKVWLGLKSYSHLNIDQNSIDSCVTKLNDQNYKKRHFLARPLSLLMSSEDFLKLAEFYKPSSFKIDHENEEASSKFEIRRHILKGLVNINQSINTLPLILLYCNEDYVPSCLSPLTSAFYKISGDQMKPFVDEIFERKAISVKKHALYITCVACSTQTVLNVLQNCQLNLSVASSFKFFLKIQTQEAWNNFKEKVLNLHKDDDSVSKLLTNTLIPMKFKSQHFETLWETINLKKINTKYKRILLTKIENNTILDIKTELLTSIINTELFTVEAMYRIVSIYAIESKAEAKFNIIVNALGNYKISPLFSGKKVSDFIFEFSAIYMEHKITNSREIELFSMRFQNIFPLSEALEENIILSILKLKGQTIHDFSKSVIVLHNNLIVKFGETVINIFVNCLKKMLPHFCKSNLQLYEFFYLLLQYRQCTEDLLLIIKSLPTDTEPEDKESFSYYNHTLSQLEEINLDKVQLHLNLHFKLHKVLSNYDYFTETGGGVVIFSSSWLHFGAQRRQQYIFF